MGTGRVVREGVIVTNRHVASVFGKEKDGSFVFRSGLDGKAMSSSADFLKEFNNMKTAVVEIEDILFIEEEDGPDLAFLKLKKTIIGPFWKKYHCQR